MSQKGLLRLFITVPVGVLLIAAVFMGLKFMTPDDIEAQEQVAISVQASEVSQQNGAAALQIQEATSNSVPNDTAMLDTPSQKAGQKGVVASPDSPEF